MKNSAGEGAFAHLCGSLYPGGNHSERLIAMFTVYVDESGTHDSSEVACVGAYVASVGQWERFDRAWVDEVLEPEGIEIFRRSDLESFHGEFKVGWDSERRKRVLRKAHRVIKRNTRAGRAAILNRTDFAQTVPGPMKRLFGGEYGWLVFDCIVLFARWAERHHIAGPIDYVFEDGAGSRRQVDRLFESILNQPEIRERNKIRTWTFSPKKCMRPLQAADLFSYEAYKHVSNRIVRGPVRPIRISARDLFRPGIDLYQYSDAGTFLRELADRPTILAHLEAREQFLSGANRRGQI